MRTEYRQINVDIGIELDDVIKILQDYNASGEKVCIEFNGHILYSDTDEDQMYKQITGRTKAEQIELVVSEENKLVDRKIIVPKMCIVSFLTDTKNYQFNAV